MRSGCLKCGYWRRAENSKWCQVCVDRYHRDVRKLRDEFDDADPLALDRPDRFGRWEEA